MNYLAAIIAVCWIGFWMYWIVSAFGTKRSAGISNVRAFFGTRVGLIVLAVVVFSAFRWLHTSRTIHLVGDPNALKAVGFVIFVLGLCMAIWARRHLGKNWGMPMTEKRNPELVTSGPYHYVRHPIYTGLLAMMLGSALDVNVYWLLVFIVATIYFVFSAVMEERVMLRQFPKTYPQYKQKTKMLIPFII